MKEIIIIRHGEKIGDNLTPEGVAACEILATRIDTFTLALASGRHRAVQTAELVSGLAVRIDNRASVPLFPDNELGKLIKAQATHPLGIIGAIWENESLIRNAHDAGQKLLNLVRETLDDLPDGGRALVVSHDGTMIGLEKLLKHESFVTVDHSFGPLQGIRVDEDLHVHHFS